MSRALTATDFKYTDRVKVTRGPHAGKEGVVVQVVAAGVVYVSIERDNAQAYPKKQRHISPGFSPSWLEKL